ncbi:Delta-9 fatty acid desaturase protein [Mycena indigotica]|uniref:E3 ubiquitin-protein ligase listerin n=1 Tax=Mycena indigotica TaxID=2126181 RepID=A0A8H6VXP2_9AGAR|nr:Delta-9 fatty acid desaturase protein [Mycena indigotica]KAF7291984.1 Delta-9 fatty acid desaturase protein [Mycena indigotica]
MPPKSSSASSATRKKHARKAAASSGLAEQPPPPREKKDKRHRSDPPRVKMYIAPVKPTSAVRDPLETTGLAHRLPPELLVVLRSLGKKAAVTKTRALEELQSGWIDRCDDDEATLYTVLDMLPVWIHHLPSNLVHPLRRIRQLTTNIHAILLRFELLRPSLIDDAPELVSGTWALAAHDIDRSVASVASASRIKPSETSSLYAFAERTLLHPDALYTELNPLPPAPPPSTTIKRPTGVAPQPIQPPRIKADESEESEPDRRARLRISAFGLLKHLLETTQSPLPAFLASHVLWSSLYHAPLPPFSSDDDEDADEEADEYAAYRDSEGLTEGLGHSQPVLRRMAWSTVSALVTRKPLPPAVVNVLSQAALRSAWVEPDGGVQGAMWGGLLGFLRDHPTAWVLAQPAYDEFLTTFLANACGGAPITAYPSIVVVLSTLPHEILFPPHTLFAAFWAALGGPPDQIPDPDTPSASTPAPALTTALPVARALAGVAFVGALLECTVYVIRRGKGHEGSDNGVSLFQRELRRVWLALDHRKAENNKDSESLLQCDVLQAASLLLGALRSAAGVGEDLLSGGLEEIDRCLRAGRNADLVCRVLAAMVGNATGHASDLDPTSTSPAQRRRVADTRIREFGRTLMTGILKMAVAREDGAFLVRALSIFGADVFKDEDFTQSVDELVSRRAYQLLLTSPTLLFAYLTHRVPKRQSVYRSLLSTLAQHPEAVEDALRVLVGPEAKQAVQGLHAADSDTTGPLDSFFVDNDTIPTSLLSPILQRKELFLSASAFNTVLARVVTTFVNRVEAALVAAPTEPIPLTAFSSDLAILTGVLGGNPELLAESQRQMLLPSMYIFAYVLPGSNSLDETEATVDVSPAANIWLQGQDDGISGPIVMEVKRQLRMIVSNPDVCVSPEDVLAAIKQDPPCHPLSIIADILPSQHELNELLETLPPDPISPTLAVLHPDLPVSNPRKIEHTISSYDKRGFSTYARTVTALIQAMMDDRRAAKDNVWCWTHVLALALYAEDLLAVPNTPSVLFDSSLSTLSMDLMVLVGKARQLETYLLTSGGDDGWRSNVISAVTSGKPITVGNPVAEFLADIIARARRSESSRDCRLLGRILRHLLQDSDRAEAELWLGLARKIEKLAPETCITIISAISASALEPSRLERYRNELAADLLSIPASKANTQGLLTLRKLAASAPNADSDVTFLPQQRAINVFKACQQWISSDDDDVDEAVETAMTRVFFYLAPLLQNIPGTHWDLVFDVIGNNLEDASLADDDTLVILAHTLRLIVLIEDLTQTNKTFRATWEERRTPILTMVRDLAAGELGMSFRPRSQSCVPKILTDSANPSVPRSTCRELVLSIVQYLPISLITPDTLPQMTHLLVDPSPDVQKLTYQLLTIAAKKRTEHLVIEAAVDTEGETTADLPSELLDILQTRLNFDHGDDLLTTDQSTTFGYLLGWMVLLDLFVDTSLKVRSSYIEQLRALDIIGTSFIPTLFSILGVDQGIPKAFKLDMWAVDEFYVSAYDSGSPWSLQVLAAHLYYRSLQIVPSLMHSWVLDCKDRTLSTNITTYTTHHFSSVLIRAELESVRAAQLSDDQLTVKIASSVNEVSASYLVDEHRLEIRLKIPSDWPLKKIEVKEVQRIGVEETRWRAWILAVQQTLWAQNGRIIDGIGLFKKNVQLHFEGQVECAICYSIISVMDASLPKKPCKTCKNRFHSGCLFKWFSSSHSSSCPLCRSDIM